MRIAFLLLISVIVCGCSKAPVEKASPATSPPSSPPPAPPRAPVAEYTNSLANELAIQIKAAQMGFEFGRAQAIQLQQQAHFGGDVGSDSELGSYSFEALTNEIISNFWQNQSNQTMIQK